MALLSDLVRIVAAVEGLEEVSVGIFARQAREAGYISQGGRGRSAAKMSATDAANLLIAVNGCSLAKDVPVMVQRIRDLPALALEEENLIGLGKPGAKFGDDFDSLIGLFAAETYDNMLTKIPGPTHVIFRRPFVKAEISIYPYVDGKDLEQTSEYRAHPEEDELFGPDRADKTIISQRTLRAVSKAISK